MPDYLLSEHLATRLGLSGDELRNFEKRRVIQGVEKNGAVYYSSRDLYRLKGVLHFMRNKGLSLDEAKDRVMSSLSLVSATDR
jgi:DNA-binding transcriptional MerR regulator